MDANMTKCSEAIYYKNETYTFGKTEFTRRQLKILLFLDGQRNVGDVADILRTDTSSLMPDFAKLLKLGLIQTDGIKVSSDDVPELIFDDSSSRSKSYSAPGVIQRPTV